jgi:cytochrome c
MTQDNTSVTAPDATSNANSSGGDLFNTAAGWVLFAGIVGLGLSVLSSKYFHGYNPERPEKLGYVIEGVEEESSGGAAAVDLGTLLASATPEAGAKVFAKCQACHSIEQGGKNGTGPNLWAIMGKPIGKQAAGFKYSGALSGKGGEWTWENMDAWLTNPRAFADGTAMSFNGLNKPEDRANLMAYLEANGGAPARPAAAAAAAPEGEEKAEEGAEGEAVEKPAAGAEAEAAEKPAE